MSTVTPSTTPIVPTLDPSAAPNVTTPSTQSAETGPATSTTPNTATLPASMKLALGFQALTVATLGIRMPSSPGDTAAILAEVAQLLDQTTDEARNTRTEQLANAMRGLLGDAGGLSEGIAQHREEYNRLEVQRDAKITERDGKVAERDALVAERSNKTSERDGLTQQANTLTTQIAALNVQIAAVTAAGGDPSALIAQRNGLQQQLATTNSRITTLNGRINELSSQINQLNAEIDQLNSEIAVLQSKMDVEKAAYESLEALRTILMNVFAQYALTIAGREDLGQLEDFNWGEDIDRLFDNLADTLKQFQLTLDQPAEVEDLTEPTLPVESQKTLADFAIDRRLAAEALALATAVAEVVAVLNNLDTLSANANGGSDDGIRLRLAV